MTIDTSKLSDGYVFVFSRIKGNIQEIIPVYLDERDITETTDFPMIFQKGFNLLREKMKEDGMDIIYD